MRPLDLDFIRHSHRSRWLGLVLLLTGLASAGLALYGYWQLKGAESGWSVRLTEAARHQGDGRAHREQTPEEAARTAAATEQARTVLNQLSRPWGSLFDALEAAGTRQVALLAVEPDPKKGVVRVSAEGKDFGAMLDYLRRLQDSGVLRDVVLASHQIREQDPERPVRFRITARWGDRS